MWADVAEVVTDGVGVRADREEAANDTTCTVLEVDERDRVVFCDLLGAGEEGDPTLPARGFS